MSDTWTCVIPGEPVAQARCRAARFGNGVRVYDPAKTANYKAYAKSVIAANKPAKLFDGPLKLIIDLNVTRPKSRPKRDLYPDRKPDADNTLKCLMDCLESTVYVNDSRVVDVTVSKRYAGESGPCAVITVKPMTNEEEQPNDRN